MTDWGWFQWLTAYLSIGFGVAEGCVWASRRARLKFDKWSYVAIVVLWPLISAVAIVREVKRRM